MRTLITTLTLSFSLAALAASPSTYMQAKTELQQVSQKDMSVWITDLIRVSAPSRMVGLPGHQKAREHLMSVIKTLDPKSTGSTSLVSFEPDVEVAKAFYQKDLDQKLKPSDADYPKWKRFTEYMKKIAETMKATKGENIIWEKTGLNQKKVLVIAAHYDTASQDPNSFMIRAGDSMPGANYNASGVAVALGLVKTLARFDLNYTVQVALLDWQSIGYLGSYQYAKELKNSGKEIIGVLNLEMLGQDTSYFDKTKKTGNMNVYTRANSQEEAFVRKLIEHGKKMTTKVNFDLKNNGFEVSDTFRFWEQGLLAATFTQNWEDDFNPKFYQTPQDTAETLNYETLHNSYYFLGGAALGTLLDLTK
jgi:hypothetical protein